MITSLEWHFPLLKNKVTSKECVARPPLSCRKVICTEFIHIILHRVGSSVFFSRLQLMLTADASAVAPGTKLKVSAVIL